MLYKLNMSKLKRFCKMSLCNGTKTTKSYVDIGYFHNIYIKEVLNSFIETLIDNEIGGS